MEILFFGAGLVCIAIYVIVAPKEGIVGCVSLGLFLLCLPVAAAGLFMRAWWIAGGFGLAALVLWRLFKWTSPDGLRRVKRASLRRPGFGRGAFRYGPVMTKRRQQVVSALGNVLAILHLSQPRASTRSGRAVTLLRWRRDGHGQCEGRRLAIRPRWPTAQRTV